MPALEGARQCRCSPAVLGPGLRSGLRSGLRVGRRRWGGGVDDDDVLALHAIGSGGLLPDLTILIDLAPAESAKRAKIRDGNASDRIGAKDEAYHAAVRERFELIATDAANRFVRIDGSGDPGDVHARIMQAIVPLVEEA